MKMLDVKSGNQTILELIVSGTLMSQISPQSHQNISLKAPKQQDLSSWDHKV